MHSSQTPGIKSTTNCKKLLRDNVTFSAIATRFFLQKTTDTMYQDIIFRDFNFPNIALKNLQENISYIKEEKP